jgi:8-oxo-dGTP pyrophosphatase MutT (NUDIX family)
MAVRTTANGRREPAAQYAALPWRRRRGHSVEILLVTTRRTGRWIVPKGWPVNGCSPGECAAREAMEEAGVLGVIAPKPIGTFPYRKQRKSGESVRCRVEVFPLQVTHQLRKWPEKTVRETCWCTAEDAVARTSDPGLRRVIAKFIVSSAAPDKCTAVHALASTQPRPSPHPEPVQG